MDSENSAQDEASSQPTEALDHEKKDQPGVEPDVVDANDIESPVDGEVKDGGPTRHYCGAGPCRPKHLQVFANSKFFTAILCLFAMTETALISGFEPVVISNLERRYRFSSLSASFIISGFDIAGVIGVIFISYFGEKGHKPRLIGIAFFIQGIGAFIFALPQFIFGKYEVGSTVQLAFEACNDTNQVVSDCDIGNTVAYALFFIGNIIIGIGVAPLFTIGITYIDDIVFPKWISLHIGIFQVSTFIGPAIGFGLGSAFLTIYVDPSETTTLTEEDPSWVGAWWLCFVVIGIVSILGSIPFLLYPRVLDDSHLVLKERQKQMTRSYRGKFGDEKSFLQQIKAFPYHIRDIFKSRSWVFMTIGITVLFLGLDGLISFAPKYLETVYQLSSSTAGLLIGALAVIAGATGALTGAIVAYCVKIGKKMTVILWVTSFLAIFPLLGFFFVCPNMDIAGINTDYSNSFAMDQDDVLLASCNSDCNCSSTVFEPVCGADGLTYFSPCRASCLKIFDNSGNPEFVDCTCVANNVFSDVMSNVNDEKNGSLSNSTAVSGLCPQSCNYLGGFLVCVTVFVFLIFMVEVPTLLVTIRTVADEQRSLALGVQSLLFKIFGSIPGPIIFGAIVDSGCVYWQTECGRRANCWVYDTHLLSTRAYIFCTLCVIVTMISTFFVWVFYPPVTTCRKSRKSSDDLQSTAKASNGSDHQKIVATNPMIVYNDKL